LSDVASDDSNCRDDFYFGYGSTVRLFVTCHYFGRSLAQPVVRLALPQAKPTAIFAVHPESS
jgi:hypothetical protein